ncbi:hypothetical protein Zmor_001401 [Zophobas morio]|uniref:Uncharacterized protein n=1 Tax=Zophobas morio TaxID=2755281 RepID=A0AA38J762_9CUCU|nr:hypothetical protein Zmor_001401 [Zophobas morio]
MLTPEARSWTWNRSNRDQRIGPRLVNGVKVGRISGKGMVEGGRGKRVTQNGKGSGQRGGSGGGGEETPIGEGCITPPLLPRGRRREDTTATLRVSGSNLRSV